MGLDYLRLNSADIVSDRRNGLQAVEAEIAIS